MAVVEPRPGAHRVAVDIGGTFTDAVCVAPDGSLLTAKVPSLPGRQDESVVNAVGLLGVQLAEVSDFIHGTTAALNALLEHRGARLALVVTKGFRDVYEIGRANRPDMYDIHYRRPERLARRRDVFELDERLAAGGGVLRKPDPADLAALVEAIGDGYEAVAVCLLHAFSNPAHEALVADALRAALPDLTVVCSHEVAPEWREYERLSTTVVSAYVTPIIREYLGRLEARLGADGLAGPLHVMQSNGGVMTARAGVRRAVQTLFSGPVGGTTACAAVGADLDARRLVCVDMGGTSFDVSLVVDGVAEVESQIALEGHPVLVPSVAIHSLGAGGGSIAYVAGGGLRVGPESAGAVPGPACYGRGGERPTVTDANLLLGRIPAHARLGGSIALDAGASRRAAAPVADALGLDVPALARGIVDVADAMMADAIRELTVARGIDPRGFDLLAFGGAGPLHAVSLAEQLDIRRVIVPASPGVLSAWGMLHARIRHDFVISHFTPLERATPAGISEALAGLGVAAASTLDAEGVAGDQRLLEPAVDVRYAGQEYTLTVPLPTPVTELSLAELRAEFDAVYLARYGHHNPDEGAELVNVRLAAFGVRDAVHTQALPPGEAGAPDTTAEAIFGGEAHATPVWSRGELGAGATVTGPCIVLEDGCTTLVPPGWMAQVSLHGHLVLTRSAA